MALQEIELLRKLYEQDPAPVFGFDSSLQITWVNAACEQQFPELMEGKNAADVFVGFGLENAISLSKAKGAAFFPSRFNGSESITVICFHEFPPLWVGRYCTSSGYSLDANREENAGGVQLLSYYIRDQVFRMLNQLDQLSEQAEEAGCYNAADSAARVEEGCLSLLRVSQNMNLYYHQEENPLLTAVSMQPYLLEILRQLEFRLIPAGIGLEYSVDCQDAVCLIPKERLEIGLLNMAAASARYLRVQSEKKRLLTCRCTAEHGELRILLTNNCSSIFEIEEGILGDEIRLDSTGELVPFKKIGYRILERAVSDAKGSCLLENGRPGIRLLVRIPVQDGLLPKVEDEPVYTPSRNTNGRFGLVNIQMSGLSD